MNREPEVMRSDEKRVTSDEEKTRNSKSGELEARRVIVRVKGGQF